MRIIAAVAVFSRWQMILMAELEDGSFVDVFTWFPDEKHYNPSHFVGMTLEAAVAKFTHDDIADLLGKLKFLA